MCPMISCDCAKNCRDAHIRLTFQTQSYLDFCDHFSVKSTTCQWWGRFLLPPTSHPMLGVWPKSTWDSLQGPIGPFHTGISSSIYHPKHQWKLRSVTSTCTNHFYLTTKIFPTTFGSEPFTLRHQQRSRWTDQQFNIATASDIKCSVS